MNEHGFVRAVHRRLPSAVYTWKVADRYTNGVPDAWYSGPTGDVWIEYKYLPRVPKRAFAVPLTKLQLNWLLAREAEGRAVAVVIGCPAGAVVLRASDCVEKVQPEEWLEVAEVASWITTQTT